MNQTIFRTLAVFCTACLVAVNVNAADHLDSPSVGNDGRLDINDLYAFQSPTNASNTVIIVTVNPLAGVLSDTTFNSRGSYEIHIDNDGDTESDTSFSFAFSRPRRGRQNVIVLQDNSVIASGRSGTDLAVNGGGTVRTGLFDDPFFFDLNGFNDGFNFTGDDFFEGTNITAIVLEVPSATLGGPNIAVWARTATGGSQFDRMGRPAINTALIPSARKNEYNQADPADDFVDFGADVEATITALSNAGNAAALTPILLPDVLTFDTSSTDGFLNGRQLADDVIDAELNLLTAGGLTTDGVDANDVAFPGVFPYLAAPHAN